MPKQQGATSRTQDSMSDKRQKNQLVLAFTEEERSEAPKAFQEGTESRTAKCETERPASHEQLMEEVCERENCWQAYKRVKANKGSPGIDGIKVGDLSSYLKQHWPTIRERWDPTFSEHSRSRGAGQRVMTNVTRFLKRRLKLKVNEAKSAVARPGERKFFGFSFSNNKEPKRRIAPKVLLRCKQKIRELTRRTRGISLEQMLKELTAYLRGWKNYFGFCQTPSILRNLDYWIRRRLRSMIWKQWKHGTVRFKELRRRDVSVGLAAKTAGSAHGPWRLANSPALAVALPNAYFASLGLPSLFDGPA